MNTHNLCFGAKIRKIGILLHSPFSIYKMGFKRVFFAWTCFPDGLMVKQDNKTKWHSSVS